MSEIEKELEEKAIDQKPVEKKSKTPKQHSESQKQISELKHQLEAAGKQLEEAKSKLSKEHDDYLRLMAEFQTFRSRTAEEKLALKATAASDTIKGLLPVLDDCERAMKMLEASSDEAAKEGTSLIYNKLKDYLKSCGLEEIEAVGKAFDTDFHEAVTQFPAPTPEQKNMVIDVAQTGYTLGGRVLRYAKVIVGA